MNFFRKLVGRLKNDFVFDRSKRPENWNLTLKDLFRQMDEGKIKSIGQPELDWARDYTRSVIPKDYRFPKKGDLYEAKSDITVDYMTSWSAPYTGGGKTKIHEGERFWVDSDPIDKQPIGCYAIAVDYDKLEERIVPKEERESPKYGSFYFSFDTTLLNEEFVLIQTNYSDQT